jgi:hypothetical protein
VGVWERLSISRSGQATNTELVRYLQTPTLFGDLRIPRDRPRPARARSLADLTDSELAAMAEQNGFFGETTLDGNVATWHHEIDFQPTDVTPDSGRVEHPGSQSLYEHGLDGSYTEHWWSLTHGDDRYLAVRVMRIDGKGTARPHQLLLVVGDHFAYARNRSVDLPNADSLSALIKTTHASRATIERYLDCELSEGYVRGGRVSWEIVRSTLPWREGRALDFVDKIAVDGAGSLAAPDSPNERWSFPENTFSADDLRVIFAKR